MPSALWKSWGGGGYALMAGGWEGLRVDGGGAVYHDRGTPIVVFGYERGIRVGRAGPQPLWAVVERIWHKQDSQGQILASDA